MEVEVMVVREGGAGDTRKWWWWWYERVVVVIVTRPVRGDGGEAAGTRMWGLCPVLLC